MMLNGFDRTTLNPLSLKFHPTRCSVSGYKVERVSARRPRLAQHARGHGPRLLLGTRFAAMVGLRSRDSNAYQYTRKQTAG